MSDLLDQIKTSFSRCQEQRADKSPLVVIGDGEELAPVFNTMRSYYSDRLPVLIRRGYHHFAGCTWPEGADAVLEKTTPVMLPIVVDTCLEAFCQGVLIGHRDHHLVRMAFFFESPEHLYHDQEFRLLSMEMAKGFAADQEVKDFFTHFVSGGVTHLAHATGYSHRTDVHPNKVWDVWMMSSTAVIASGYLAGHMLGLEWKERDVLRDIEIDLEGVRDGSGGEDPADS